ncbi:MAG: diaminopimelate decarboxylase [Spongiibacteraceae bacterium]|nr:diaminopimelate decarboxylase [Spongiibacteraceae bacterium]
MNAFEYRNGELYAENVPLAAIAEQYGTPTYVYSRAYIEQQFLSYQQALRGREHLICYAVKANSNIAVLNILAKLGAGFDIVSIGELERVLAAGGEPSKVVFSGVAKIPAEMQRALEVGIHCFNLESEAELDSLQQVAARLDMPAKISVRVNPDVDANTHPYISTGLKENKFGIAIEQAPDVYRKAAQMSHIEAIGIDCHIGSQLTQISPFLAALDAILSLIDTLANDNITISHLDLGGGLGVRYSNETPPAPSEYVAAVIEHMKGHKNASRVTLAFEPGRSIVANAGVLLTRVEYLKCNPHKNFALIDAAMNDMIRPALYQAWLDINPVNPRNQGEAKHYDLVGPVCETGDFLGKDREMILEAGDLLSVASPGAYGFTMSSNYNSRTRAAEVMVDGNEIHLIRARETIADLMQGEALIA